MKLIIDIPVPIYKKFAEPLNPYSREDVMILHAAIWNGTPLAKVIGDIMDEIDEQWYIVKRESIECAEGLEMASEIITKHISGAMMDGEEWQRSDKE